LSPSGKRASFSRQAQSRNIAKQMTMETTSTSIGIKKYLPILNWLPAPDGPFALALRIYWPGQDVLDGKWQPSAIKKA